MENKILVSVIIPTYKDWDRLRICLGALEKQSVPINSFEIIIVNNDNPNSTPSNYKMPDNAQLIHESKPGSYAARNRAIEVAKGGILAFTDSDCIPDRKWIENALKHYMDDAVDRIGGKVEIFCRNPQKKSWAELYEMMFAFDQYRNITRTGTSVTANLFARKELFNEVGLFNSDKKSGEDFGWNKRASAMGIKLMFGDDVIVKHPARQSIKELIKKRRRVVGGKNYSFRSLADVYESIKYLPRLFIFNLLPSVYRVLKSDRGFSVREKLKIIYVSILLYTVNVSEYFKLVFGKETAR